MASYLFNLCVILCLLENVTANDDRIIYSYQFGTGYGNREELIISNVTSYDQFQLGHGILKWKTITVHEKNYAVGVTDNGLCIMTAERNESNIITDDKYIELNGTVSDFVLFKTWNNTARAYKIFVVVAIIAEHIELEWFMIDEDKSLEKVWTWHLHKTVLHLNHFNVEDSDKLLIISANSNNCTTGDLYRFVFTEKERNFWLIQTIAFDDPVKYSAINRVGPDYFLSIPQNASEVVSIYKYTKTRFTPFKNLTTGHVNFATSFEIGYKSYLAIDGFNAGIYRFTVDGPFKEKIEHGDLDGVDYWLPIPVKTYRDDIILLAQRSLDHATHKSLLIEVIISNAGDFIMHDEMPCKYFGEVTHGMNCLVEEGLHNDGINGSAALWFGSYLGILIPNKKEGSNLFILGTELKEIPSPVEMQVEKLKAIRKRLQNMMDDQRNTMKKIEKRIENPAKFKQFRTDPSEVTSSAFGTSSDSRINSKAERLKAVPEIDLDGLVFKLNDIKETVARMDAKVRNSRPVDLQGKQIEHLIVTGPVEVQNESTVQKIYTEKFNEEDADTVFNDFVRVDDIKPIPSLKTFTSLNVENITFNSVNGISAKNLLFETDDPIVIKGDLIFENVVEVLGDVIVTSGKVNDLNIEEEIIQAGRTYEDQVQFENIKVLDTLEVQYANKFPLHSNNFESFDVEYGASGVDKIEFESIYIPGNVTITNINGENFDDILHRICMTNIDTYVPGETFIDGDLIITREASLNYLNDLKYPEEYVLTDSPSFTKIYGKKTFENTVSVNELITHGLVNGIDTSKVITLSENQTIPGKTTFTDLTVTECLEVDGRITGLHVEDFLPNPTLTETNVIKSNVIFQTLEVDGVLTIGDKFNGTRFDALLQDVVCKDEEILTINSVKEFSEGITVRKNANVLSNSINNIPLDAFITTDTDQVLNMQVLNGDVTFENLNLGGLLDGINITKLDQEVVKLNGEQYISSTLTFEDELTAENFQVYNTLNGLQPDEYYYTNDDRRFTMLTGMENVLADEIIVEGDFQGKISNFDLDEFENRRLSLTKDQVITADFTVDNANIENIKVTNINGYPYEDLLDEERFAEIVVELLLENKLVVKELNVFGDLTIGTIDGVPLEDVLKTSYFANNSDLNLAVSFKDNVEFDSIEIENFNGVNFEELISNLIYKNETNVEITGFKLFTEGFEVTNYIDTKLLNDIPLKYILRKTGDQEIVGPLTIEGDISILSDVEAEYINGVPIRYITESFKVLEDGYEINGDVYFERSTYMDNLVVSGFVNGIKLTDFFEHVVSIHDSIIIPGNTTFTDEVLIKGKLDVSNDINGIDLSKFKDEVVLISEDAYIEGHVTFAQPVKINSVLYVETDLDSRYVMGIDLQGWKDNAVYIDRGFIPGTLTFESVTVGDYLQTDFINSIDMSSLIPLRTEQFIPASLYIGELSSPNDIIVDNLVNGVNLEAEFCNTLMREGDQIISSKMTFTGSVLVRDNVNIFGLVNGKDINKVVTTNTSQNLTASYRFTNDVFFESDLIVHGLVNGINITEWAANSIKTSGDEPQRMSAKWNVLNNMTFENNVEGTGLISGLDVQEMVDVVDAKTRFKNEVEQSLANNYGKLCEEINYLLRGARKQIYKFKYLENIQFIDFTENIENVHHFSYQGIDYLLVNEENSCYASLFTWSNSQFSLITHVATGRVSQFITVREGNSLYLVGRSAVQLSPCPIEGTNIWRMEDDLELLHTHKIENLLLLQESLLPGTFYGLQIDSVSEFKLSSNPESSIKKYRTWSVSTDNTAFVPQGLGTGLALRNGFKMTKLLQKENVIEDFPSYNVEAVHSGNTTEEANYFLPGLNGGDITVLNVGKIITKPLLAVATLEDTSVKGRVDFIKIYEDIITGKLFHIVSAYKPSSLVSLEFGNNGETLLVFLENQRTLQVYEYKGIEGFKHRSSANVEGQKLVLMQLPMKTNRQLSNVLGLINKNRLSLIAALMDGNQVNIEDVNCQL